MAALNAQGVSWLWMLVGGIRPWNQGARLRVLSRKSSSTSKFELWTSLVTGKFPGSVMLDNGPSTNSLQLWLKELTQNQDTLFYWKAVIRSNHFSA